MQRHPITKYKPFPQIDLPNRQWPSRTIDKAPIWCSVDLRDGNQALATPMSVEEKVEFFKLLVQVGFKQIEVGFPSASQIEFDFMRRLVADNLIPDDVTVQVLVQSREDLIRRTFESLEGVKRAIVHLYNSTSPAQRKIVFNLDKQGVIDLAVSGTRLVKRLTEELVASGSTTDITFQYSPESFSLTEVDFSLQVCEAVMEAWGPTAEKKMILNLPVTVEIATPNVHADQIEWFCTHMKHRDRAWISLHTHNDRGTGVAATELALMAGADRVEGTLFGNGERTGNVDIVIVALNMYCQGVDPGLDFSNLNAVREVYERCTRMDIHERHPYSGDLVFTAFSGSHQDAINKGLKYQSQREKHDLWEVPYLPIDPRDMGRSYRAIIRINSQSGKGGVAYVMENEFGFQLPKLMHKELGRLINQIADQRGAELDPEDIYKAFAAEYLERDKPLKLKMFRTWTLDNPSASASVDEAGGSGGPAPVLANKVCCEVLLENHGKDVRLQGCGNGPINALVEALLKDGIGPFEILDFREHSMGRGAEAKAVAYIELRDERVKAKGRSDRSWFGAAIDTNIELASIRAVISALNRASQTGE
ncbi:2-isopropylmalate synthase [Verrucomicrobia bacterium LW23]|nr:2-isopropylmalate synthase [Verrucomicrobia bacterium LW23]